MAMGCMRATPALILERPGPSWAGALMGQNKQGGPHYEGVKIWAQPMCHGFCPHGGKGRALIASGAVCRALCVHEATHSSHNTLFTHLEGKQRRERGRETATGGRRGPVQVPLAPAGCHLAPPGKKAKICKKKKKAPGALMVAKAGPS